MIGETQPERQLLEVVAFVYPFLPEAVSLVPSATRTEFFNAESLDFICSYKRFFKKTLVAHTLQLSARILQGIYVFCSHLLSFVISR